MIADRSQSFFLFVVCRRALDRLIGMGEGDSPDADTLRDGMDPLWRDMTDEERAEASRP